MQTSYVNIALNKPTWQSSVLYGLTSDLAVDGDMNNMAHTDKTDTVSWWAVDLGTLTHVFGVNLTNRKYSSGELFFFLYYNLTTHEASEQNEHLTPRIYQP
jgi:hypothetical protein